MTLAERIEKLSKPGGIVEINAENTADAARVIRELVERLEVARKGWEAAIVELDDYAKHLHVRGAASPAHWPISAIVAGRAACDLSKEGV